MKNLFPFQDLFFIAYFIRKGSLMHGSPSRQNKTKFNGNILRQLIYSNFISLFNFLCNKEHFPSIKFSYLNYYLIFISACVLYLGEKP